MSEHEARRRGLLTCAAAARRLGVHPNTLRLWVAKRRLKSTRIGKRRYVPLREIERLLAGDELELEINPPRP